MSRQYRIIQVCKRFCFGVNVQYSSGIAAEYGILGKFNLTL